MFDPQAILQRVGGDNHLLHMLVDTFLNEAPMLVAGARVAIARLEWDKAGLAAHNLRGLAAHIGASEVATAAKSLEELLDEILATGAQSAAGADNIVGELAAAVEQSSEQLTQFLHTGE